MPAQAIITALSVHSAAGATSSGNFYVAPVVSDFTPTHGLPGTNVFISGGNFLDASAVKFSGVNATYSVLNNTLIQATVPNGAQTGSITVVAPAGTNVSVASFVLDYTSDLKVSISNSPASLITSNTLTYVALAENLGPFVNANVTSLTPEAATHPESLRYYVLQRIAAADFDSASDELRHALARALQREEHEAALRLIDQTERVASAGAEPRDLFVLN